MNMISCPTCGAQVPAGAIFCDNCGSSLAGVPARPATAPPPAVNAGPLCPTCGESVLPGEMFCGNCGASLAPAAPSYAPPAAPAPWESSQPSWPPPAAPQPAAPWESSSPSWPSDPKPQAVGNACPTCGAAVQPSDTFCDNCGQVLTPVAPGLPREPQIPAQAESYRPDPLPPARPEPVVVALNPRLQLQASGATLNLPPGKSDYLIGREDPVSGSYPDVDLVPYGGEEGGVSRRHAQISRRSDQFVIEDLNSVNYTFVNRQKVAPGVAQPLQDGDEIRLGRVVMQFKLK